MMLTLHTTISRVEADITNGSNHNRYQGNTAGAHKRAAAIGQAKVSSDHLGVVLRSHVAVTSPASSASPANNCGGTIGSSAAKTGPLKRKVRTYVPSEPIGIRPW